VIVVNEPVVVIKDLGLKLLGLPGLKSSLAESLLKDQRSSSVIHGISKFVYHLLICYQKETEELIVPESLCPSDFLHVGFYYLYTFCHDSNLVAPQPMNEELRVKLGHGASML
jgi:hypothetical protein